MLRPIKSQAVFHLSSLSCHIKGLKELPELTPVRKTFFTKTNPIGTYMKKEEGKREDHPVLMTGLFVILDICCPSGLNVKVYHVARRIQTRLNMYLFHC